MQQIMVQMLFMAPSIASDNSYVQPAETVNAASSRRGTFSLTSRSQYGHALCLHKSAARCVCLDFLVTENSQLIIDSTLVSHPIYFTKPKSLSNFVQ